MNMIGNYLDGQIAHIATLETALRSIKKILAHDYRGLPISEIEREEMLRIIRGVER